MEITVAGTEFNRYPSKYAREAYDSDTPVRIERKYAPREYVTLVPTAWYREAEEALREKREREGAFAEAA